MSYMIAAAMLVIGALILLFIGSNVLVGEVRNIGDTRRLRGRMADVSRSDAVLDEEVDGGGFFEMVGRATTRSQRTLTEFEQIMRSTGRYDAGAPYWLAGLRLVAGVGLAIAAFVVGLLMAKMSTALLSGIVGFAIGYLGPRYYLSSLARSRRRRIERELPFLIDMLLLLVRSGASIEQAFRHLTQEEADGLGTIKGTLDRLVNDIDQGKGYEVSLQRWGTRLAVDEGREFAALLIQSLAHGTELTAALKIFSDTLIERRMNGARMTIGQRMTQLTVVMMLFMMPPLLIVIAGPAVSRLIEGLTKVNGG
ncbi:type II secretion system F family protein [Zavarzinia sp.]|uniref:type II secretion system F family protein n=1 Tax=Zavarzinia sp. TaxID=2027920 RepID=UPI003BB752BE|nr:type II secretion system F family protein [Zavarzinia sp.]